MDSIKFYKELGLLLKKYRQECLLSQQDISDKLKVSRSLVSSWEQGRRVIYIHDLYKLCDLYNIDPNIPLSACKKYLYKD